MKVFTPGFRKTWLGAGAGMLALLGGFYLALNYAAHPEPKWQNGESWTVQVEQRADHLMTNDPPWITINNLEMQIIQNSSGPDGTWCVEIHDLDGRDLFPGVQKLQVYYSDDFAIVGGHAVTQNSQTAWEIQEFWDYSLYGRDFFEINPETTKIKRLLSRNPESVILNEEKGRTCTWEKNQSWWTNYQSDNPPLRATLYQDQ